MKYYLTTPIYYVNATPHIGHAYTTAVADTIKRFRRMLGDEVHLTTGTDEHGTNVERSARRAGWEPQQFADRVSAAFRAEWDELGFEYDSFRRTTDPKHAKAVQEIFTRCLENGAIYKDSYTGKYHVSDEAFVTDEEAAPGRSRQDHHHHRGELLLPAVGVPREAPRSLPRATRLHPARDAAQRGALVRRGWG